MVNARNARAQYLRARDAATGRHGIAATAPTRITDFEVGDTVEVMQTGHRGPVSGKTSWGDYELENTRGFFSGKQLKLIARRET